MKERKKLLKNHEFCTKRKANVHVKKKEKVHIMSSVIWNHLDQILNFKKIDPGQL